MTDADADDAGSFFAPPAFKPEEALVDLRRRLRELRVFNERQTATGAALDIKGHSVVDLQAGPGQINAKLAKRPARTPEWEARVLKSSADVRGFVDEVKRRVASWEDE